ncbi:MAG: hypothetical protein ACD_20C00346G0015 [uncultured bacterium]|nr:MAG: hypothetical protein ACD_20C00346G0015 [uncultured bacterium]HBH18437.1 hypothetical protein [Cyanobacteria bacterium UBA9579]
MFGCFGCLFNFIRTIISTIAIACVGYVILFPCGGLNYIQDFVDAKLHPAQTEVEARAQQYGDFSKIPKEYKLTRTINMFGANAVIAEHTQTKQKLAIIDPGPILKLTKRDVNATTINAELKKVAARFDSLPVKLSKLELGETGAFKAFGQDVPYIQAKISLTGNTNRETEGIIGVIDSSDSKNKIIVSGSELDKYDQKITEKYFNTVKLKTPPEK